MELDLANLKRGINPRNDTLQKLYQQGNTHDGKPPVILQEVRWEDEKEDS